MYRFKLLFDRLNPREQAICELTCHQSNNGFERIWGSNTAAAFSEHADSSEHLVSVIRLRATLFKVFGQDCSATKDYFLLKELRYFIVWQCSGV